MSESQVLILLISLKFEFLQIVRPRSVRIIKARPSLKSESEILI